MATVTELRCTLFIISGEPFCRTQWQLLFVLFTYTKIKSSAIFFFQLWFLQRLRYLNRSRWRIIRSLCRWDTRVLNKQSFFKIKYHILCTQFISITNVTMRTYQLVSHNLFCDSFTYFNMVILGYDYDLAEQMKNFLCEAVATVDLYMDIRYSTTSLSRRRFAELTTWGTS